MSHAAHLGQGSYSSPAADGGDDNSPFAALLDDNAAPQPAAPPSGQKLFARPPDGGASRSVATEAATSGGNTPASGGNTQATNGPQPSSKPQQQAPDPNVSALAAPDPTASASQSDPLTGATTADSNAQSGTTGSPSPRTGKKSDAKDSNADAPAVADPSAGQQPPPPPPIAAPALPLASAANQNGSPDGDASDEGGTDGAPDAAQLAAMSGGAIRAATPRGQSPNLQNTGKASEGTSGKPGVPAFDPTQAAGQGPSQAPSQSPGQAPGQSQQASSHGAHATDGSTAARAANDPPASDSPAADAAPPAADPTQIADPTADTDRDPASKLIDSIAGPTLDALSRQVDKPETTTAPPGSLQANGASQAPNAVGASIAPTLTSTTAPTAGAPSPASTNPPTVPIAGLAVAIAAQAQNGNSRFDIRLDPPELGRIDVRLDVDRDGKVTSHLIADRPETLDLLRRDAPQIEKSLQQAGLKTGDDGLQFSLRDNGTSGGFNNFGGNPYPNNGSSAGPSRVIIPDRDLPPVDAAATGYGRAASGSGGVDIRV